MYAPDQANLKILKREYAEGLRRTIFFVGAGCSVEVGLPSWRTLATQVFDHLSNATPSSALQGSLLRAFHDIENLFDKGDFWSMFQTMEANWPQAYNDSLGQIFSPEKMENVDIPKIYESMWKMRNVKQILTLNVDGLLSRAYASVFGSKAPKLFEYPGTAVTDSQNYFSRNFPTLLHLHGVYSSRSTWVMSLSERDRLFSMFAHNNYLEFLKYVFANYNVVFIGVNIRDTAVSPIIEALTKSNLLKNHFWITSNVTHEAFKWSESNGVRVISYIPDMDIRGKITHSSTLCSILDDVEKHVSFDSPAILPSLPVWDQDAAFPKPSELVASSGYDRMAVRRLLSDMIEQLSVQHGYNSRHVDSFIKEYDVPLQLSSIVGIAAGYDGIMDYKVSTEISKSSSSTVWLANQSDGGSYGTIKVASSQALADKTERESFRRGIESLYYLSKSNNMVAPRYISHSNVPLAVAMEHIQGETLKVCCEIRSKLVQEQWLGLAKKLFLAVVNCHISEGRVLHRDIKPKNIILSGMGYDPEDWNIKDCEVKLINFDMSWHKLSSGNSKSVSADEVGFYAPEQKSLSNSGAPRDAKTDVYMLGMALYYLIAKEPPPEGGSRIIDWSELVRKKIRHSIKDVLCAHRVERLIIEMTLQDTSERPDLREAIAELESIEFAAAADWTKVDPDILAEKILVESGLDYEWSDKDLSGSIITARNVNLSISLVPRGQRLMIKFLRQKDAATDRKNFGGRIGDFIREVSMEFKQLGWQIEEGGGASRSLSAQLPSAEFRRNFDSRLLATTSLFKKLARSID